MQRFPLPIIDGLVSDTFSLHSYLGCSIDFENLNYTVITSQCKGPRYPAKLCCTAFKEFACPYADQLNDGTNDCATTMFSYINLYGKYPPGLFASECREGNEGLACDALPPASDDADASTGSTIQSSFSLVVLVQLVLFLGSIAFLC